MTSVGEKVFLGTGSVTPLTSVSLGEFGKEGVKADESVV
jgi:hypothetical protein